ncbi:hypothetical protein ACIBK9_48210 [Nonomuraea sp. NPDC050227]|uniref:hypothetical protein n=1 Tax=Nonomuraea sp. NPDC050227 TaxID=3364360 RepID=UPI0037A8648B
MGLFAARFFALAAVGMLVTAALPAAPVRAAAGALIINGEVYYKPHGCYPIRDLPAYVLNETDGVAFIHEGPSCDVDINAVLLSGRLEIARTGKSVFIG